MASIVSRLKTLVPQLKSSLETFQSSGAKFCVLKTVHPQYREPLDPTPASQQDSPRTLFILDSSFNPPTVAHKAIALSALKRLNESQHAAPERLLLLFAVMNADKAPSPAAFEQRLAMMTVLATELVENVLRDSPENCNAVPIDIGVTTAPYYTDKTAAIESEGAVWYPDRPKHVHLIGYDTLTRFFTAKYYQKFVPPFSALNPYFENGHTLRATLRPDDDYGTVGEQYAFHENLRSGGLEKDGAKREWAEQVQLVKPNLKTGVSSTKIRKAAQGGDWQTVRELCTPGVAQWVEENGLYAEETSGAKGA